MKFNELDVVKTTKDFSENGINNGDIGVVVFSFTTPNEAYEVEFNDSNGKPKATFPILPQHLELAHETNAKPIIKTHVFGKLRQAQ